MTTRLIVPVAGGSGSRSRWQAFTAAFVALLFAANVTAQAPAAPGDAAAAPPPQDLEKLVDRIALYPDDLVAIILPAATNPLQIVQADRFLEKRKADPKAPLDDKWDDSVKTLLNYPEVVKSMSADLDWTAALGEAVVEDQGEVLEAIQAYRRKVQSVGNLKSDPKQTVVVEKEVIKIVPADPQVVYVPQYNPSTVVVSGGYPSYGYYPAPYPSYYYPYPPGAALATGLIWGAAIGAAWSGNHYGAHYGGGGGNTININNSTNINRSGSASQRPAGSGSGTSQWKSNKQPGQVSGSVGKTSSARVGDARGGGGAGAGGARASAQPAGGGRDLGGGAGGRDAGGGARPSAQPAGGGAFGGSNTSGRQTQMDSSRGASSRGSSGAGAGSRPSPSMSGGGGGARAGGGGGGGGRGGGGGGGGRGGGGGGGRR